MPRFPSFPHSPHGTDFNSKESKAGSSYIIPHTTHQQAGQGGRAIHRSWWLLPIHFAIPARSQTSCSGGALSCPLGPTSFPIYLQLSVRTQAGTILHRDCSPSEEEFTDQTGIILVCPSPGMGNKLCWFKDNLTLPKKNWLGKLECVKVPLLHPTWCKQHMGTMLSTF